MGPAFSPEQKFASCQAGDAWQRWCARLCHGDTYSQILSKSQVLGGNTRSAMTAKVQVQKGRKKVPKSFPLYPSLVMDRKLVGLFAGECRCIIATIYDRHLISYWQFLITGLLGTEEDIQRRKEDQLRSSIQESRKHAQSLMGDTRTIYSSFRTVFDRIDLHVATV